MISYNFNQILRQLDIDLCCRDKIFGFFSQILAMRWWFKTLQFLDQKASGINIIFLETCFKFTTTNLSNFDIRMLQFYSLCFFQQKNYCKIISFYSKDWSSKSVKPLFLTGVGCWVSPFGCLFLWPWGVVLPLYFLFRLVLGISFFGVFLLLFGHIFFVFFLSSFAGIIFTGWEFWYHFVPLTLKYILNSV